MRNTCAGYCCESFTLGRGSLEYIEKVIRLRDDEAEFIIDMIVPLGSYNRNPLFIVAGDEVGVVEEDAGGAAFFTCRHFEEESRDCSVYAERPKMCRKFPNDGACPYEGCDFAVPYQMVRSEYWDGMWVSKGLFLAECEQFAKALGVPAPTVDVMRLMMPPLVNHSVEEAQP